MSAGFSSAILLGVFMQREKTTTMVIVIFLKLIELILQINLVEKENLVYENLLPVYKTLSNHLSEIGEMLTKI